MTVCFLASTGSFAAISMTSKIPKTALVSAFSVSSTPIWVFNWARSVHWCKLLQTSPPPKIDTRPHQPKVLTIVPSEYLSTKEAHSNLGRNIRRSYPTSLKSPTNLRQDMAVSKIYPKGKSCNQRYYCSFSNCAKTFTRKGGAVEHYRVHSDEMPYTCKSCLKSFKWRSSLRYHISSRTCEKRDENRLTDESQIMVYRQCLENPNIDRQCFNSYRLNHPRSKNHIDMCAFKREDLINLDKMDRDWYWEGKEAGLEETISSSAHGDNGVAPTYPSSLSIYLRDFSFPGICREFELESNQPAIGYNRRALENQSA